MSHNCFFSVSNLIKRNVEAKGNICHWVIFVHTGKIVFPTAEIRQRFFLSFILQGRDVFIVMNNLDPLYFDNFFLSWYYCLHWLYLLELKFHFEKSREFFCSLLVRGIIRSNPYPKEQILCIGKWEYVFVAINFHLLSVFLEVFRLTQWKYKIFLIVNNKN